MGTPLLDRIKEAEQRRAAQMRYLRPAEPTEITPRWLRRLTPRDFTDSIYSNGTFQPRNDGGAA